MPGFVPRPRGAGAGPGQCRQAQAQPGNAFCARPRPPWPTAAVGRAAVRAGGLAGAGAAAGMGDTICLLGTTGGDGSDRRCYHGCQLLTPDQGRCFREESGFLRTHAHAHSSSTSPWARTSHEFCGSWMGSPLLAGAGSSGPQDLRSHPGHQPSRRSGLTRGQKAWT